MALDINVVRQAVREFKGGGITKEQLLEIYDWSPKEEDEDKPLPLINRREELVVYMMRNGFSINDITTTISMIVKGNTDELIKILHDVRF